VNGAADVDARAAEVKAGTTVAEGGAAVAKAGAADRNTLVEKGVQTLACDFKNVDKGKYLKHNETIKHIKNGVMLRT
jgi:hypothetical protein